MSKEEIDTRVELEKVLRKFSVEQLREHATRELEPGSWNRALQAIQMANVSQTSQHLSSALTSVQRKQPHRECIENLKLKAAGLSTHKTWQVFQLGQRMSSSRDVSLPEAARAIGTTLDMPVRVTQGTHGCLLFGIGRRMSVAAFYSETSTLMVAFKTHQYIQHIATALGYGQVKDCHLSGRHMLSLLRIIQAKNGGRSLLNTININDQQNIQHLPTRTKYGLDFSQCKKTATRVEEKLGADPPKLQSLSVTTEVPVKDRSFPISTRVTLSSCDVMASLKDMAENGLIDDDNFYFVMIEKGRSELTVKYHDS